MTHQILRPVSDVRVDVVNRKGGVGVGVEELTCCCQEQHGQRRMNLSSSAQTERNERDTMTVTLCGMVSVYRTVFSVNDNL